MADLRVKLTFPEELVRRPVLADLVRQFGVIPNIRRAAVEEHSGWLICELSGTTENLDEAQTWLAAQGIHVDLLGDVLES
jgi:L-aspartate semialdehyde sulfurtransferase ferredoxin